MRLLSGSHCQSFPRGWKSYVLISTRNGNEWPRAYVVLREEFVGKVTDADIIEWMKDRVAKHKWLQGGVVFVDEIPKLASGKIQRKIMRQWAQRDADRIGREQTHKIAAKL